MGQVITLASSPAISRAFARLNRVATTLDDVEAVIPDVGSEELLDLWRDLNAVEARLWQVRAALSYHLTERAHAAVGRGRKDEQEQGVTAAVTKLAAELDVSPTTIWQDRRIYEKTRHCFTSCSNLRERGYFVLAAGTDDPEATLQGWASEKDGDSFFSVKRAHASLHPESSSSSSPDVLAIVTALESTVPTESDDYRDGWLDALMALRRRLGASSSS